jgi:hypothetical protein
MTYSSHKLLLSGDLNMTQTDTSGLNTITNGAKLVGETFLPGASLLMDGQFVNGVAHAAVGIAARLALGPIGFILVAADSFSKSTTDKHLWDHVSGAYKEHADKKKEAAAEKAAAADQEAGVVVSNA